MGPMLNVRHLVVFRAVVKTGSVSAAARTLHISQPAVTKTVRLLEDEIGLPLFSRGSRDASSARRNRKR